MGTHHQEHSFFECVVPLFYEKQVTKSQKNVQENCDLVGAPYWEFYLFRQGFSWMLISIDESIIQSKDIEDCRPAQTPTKSIGLHHEKLHDNDDHFKTSEVLRMQDVMARYSVQRISC